ncbi:MAG: transcriptional regulator [Spirochaetae bacterium HGW-Spirochaetae-7]|jgi:ArsR family transcriptional regulator|nr:MAG: transcriptional regulator [Spirochaetae bacterium HGW-Spirochaetae-7]
MNETDRQRLTERAALLKSLAHPSRLLILEMLEKVPCSVGELTEAVGADITTISKHLAVLKRAGLVRDTKRGTWSYYELVCGCVTHLVDCIEQGRNGVEPQCYSTPPVGSTEVCGNAGKELE